MFFYKIKTLWKQYWNLHQVEYLKSYFLYELNHTLHIFTGASELKFQNSDPMSKIVQNVSFLPVGQNSDLSLKLNPTHQHKS